MQKNVEVESLDYFGYGIAHLDSKVIFIENALPGEVVSIEIIKDKKNYSEAKVIEYIKKSKDRIDSICPYFPYCGGCNLLFYDYENTLRFKLNKVKELITKNKIQFDKENLEIIKNEQPYFYRNKVSLKIINNKIGYYKDSTHELVEIKECKIAKKSINEIIKNYSLLHIENGNLTIRTNYNDEILLVIETSEENYNIELGKLKEIVKLVGIIYNGKTIYGDNFFYERIGGMLFKVSFNSFFQVNPFITSKLFGLLEDNIDLNSKVLDLYCGVGTLSIVASNKAKEVYGIEIIKNAVMNGTFNANLNKCKNIEFMLGDVSKIISKINYNFDTLIVDPPRKGLDKNTIHFIKDKLPQKIIYISCDVSTLMRDLKLLEENYIIKTYKILDMFSYTYHLESFVVLTKRGLKDV